MSPSIPALFHQPKTSFALLLSALVWVIFQGEESDLAITGLSLLGVYALLTDSPHAGLARYSPKRIWFTWAAFFCLAAFFVVRSTTIAETSVAPARLAIGLALLCVWTLNDGKLAILRFQNALIVLFLLAIPDRVLLFTVLDPIFSIVGWSDLTQPTAILAHQVTNWAGMSTQLNGTQITTPAASVTVWGPCDGALTMDFMLKLSLILVLVFGIEKKKWPAIVLLALIGAFIINGLRIALLVYFAHQHQISYYDFFHEGSGNIVFALTPIGLLMVYAYFQMGSRPEQKHRLHGA